MVLTLATWGMEQILFHTVSARGIVVSFTHSTKTQTYTHLSPVSLPFLILEESSSPKLMSLLSSFSRQIYLDESPLS